MTTWFVYLLRCHDHTLYTGVTTDLKRRLAQHNAGTGAKYTRGRRPVKLVWSAKVKTEGAAKKREAEIKKLNRPDKEKMI